MHDTFYRKCNGIFHARANSEYQASPRGGGGRGLGTRLITWPEEVSRVAWCEHTLMKQVHAIWHLIPGRVGE